METHSNNPLSDIAEGATNSVIKNSIGGIKSLALKFINNQLLFIGDAETIKNVREQLKTNEELFYKIYIENKEKRNLILMGLAIRKMDKTAQYQKRTNLQNKIFDKFKKEGLHLASLVQNGILSRYINILLENIESPEILKESIDDFLDNIENYVCFIKNEHSIEEIVGIVKTKIISHSPEVFIISGMGRAKEKARESYTQLSKLISLDYSCEINSTEKRELIFLTRKKELNLDEE